MVDYAQLLLSEETRIAAAEATGDPSNLAGRLQAVANPETETITVTVQGVGSEATLADTEALIQAFADRVR